MDSSTHDEVTRDQTPKGSGVGNGVPIRTAANQLEAEALQQETITQTNEPGKSTPNVDIHHISLLQGSLAVLELAHEDFQRHNVLRTSFAIQNARTRQVLIDVLREACDGRDLSREIQVMLNMLDAEDVELRNLEEQLRHSQLLNAMTMADLRKIVENEAEERA